MGPVRPLSGILLLLWLFGCQRDEAAEQPVGESTGVEERRQRLDRDPFSEIRTIGGGGWDRRARQRLRDPHLRPAEVDRTTPEVREAGD